MTESKNFDPTAVFLKDTFALALKWKIVDAHPVGGKGVAIIASQIGKKVIERLIL